MSIASAWALIALVMLTLSKFSRCSSMRCRMFARYRANILQRMDEHRENFESVNITKAIKAHAEAIDMAVAKQDYRAIPALVDPAIKALYKHTDEQAEKPMIVLNLGGMAGRLDEPPTEVEHEMLPAEIEEHDEPSI